MVHGMAHDMAHGMVHGMVRHILHHTRELAGRLVVAAVAVQQRQSLHQQRR